MWFLPLLLSPNAEALTDDRSGISIDWMAGGDLQVPPARGGLIGLTSFGWWAGNYDQAYAIGRYWGLNLNGRATWQPSDDLSVAPHLELRRGVDLVVAGWYVGVGGGPVVVPGDSLTVGWGGRLAFCGEFRRSRFWGLTLRLEAGIDGLGDQIAGAGALLLGVQFSRPADGNGVE